MTSTVFSHSDPLQPKNPQLEPLELNPKTGEPFLRVEGFDDIIITPLRWEDAPTYIPYLNDPAVYRWMAGPPVPYLPCELILYLASTIPLASLLISNGHCLPADAEFWSNRIIPPQKATLFEFEKARDQPGIITADICPVNSIRKINEDGTDVFIGAIDIFRNANLGELVLGGNGEYLVDMSQKEENQKKNEGREVGDPDIIWEFGGAFPCYDLVHLIARLIQGLILMFALRLHRSRISRPGYHDRLRQDHPRKMGHPTLEDAHRTRDGLRRQHREHESLPEEWVHAYRDVA